MIRDVIIQKRINKQKHIRNNDKIRNMDLISSLFHRLKDEKDYSKIDDDTCRDLNLDSLYERIDFTSTTPGEQVLYRMLRSPEYDEVVLNEREKIYDFFKNDSCKRRDLSKNLNDINTNRYSVFDLIDKPLVNLSKLKMICNLARATMLVILLLFATMPSSVTMTFLMSAMLLNIYIHFSASKDLVGQIETVIYLGKMIKISEKLIELTIDSPFDPDNRMSYLRNNLSHISNKVAMISLVKNIPLIGELISIMLLNRENIYFRLCDEVNLYSDDVMELYELIGTLDANLSVIDYRDSLGEYTIPVFVNKGCYYDVLEIRHPLLDNPIGNDLVCKSNGIVITGSNMSGKSTFLRTVGINAILAQTINTTVAKKYHTSFFRVISSICINDNIHTGKSYYRSEAESIKRVIEESNGEITILSLIDEIFKGTNPVERIHAACEILNYIVKKNTLSIVTTHDINLLPLITSYQTHYFSETIINNQLNFDYKIKKGVSPNGNATQILEMMGYPKVIIDNIYERNRDAF